MFVGKMTGHRSRSLGNQRVVSRTSCMSAGTIRYDRRHSAFTRKSVFTFHPGEVFVRCLLCLFAVFAFPAMIVGYLIRTIILWCQSKKTQESYEICCGRVHDAANTYRMASLRGYATGRKVVHAGAFSLRRLLDFSTYQPQTDVNRPLRVSLVAVGVMFAATLICVRLNAIQNTERDRWLQLAGKQHNTSIEIQGVRGTIRDAAGRALAVSVQAASFGAHPRQIENKAEIAGKLSKILELDPSVIAKMLSQDKSFVWLARGLPFDAAENVRNLKIKGIVTIPEFRRYYPHAELAAPLLGRVNRDGLGQAGIEAAYERNLKADTITVDVNRDAKGRLVAGVTDHNIPFGSIRGRGLNVFQTGAGLIPATLITTPTGVSSMRQEGKDVLLSIDAYIQNIVEEELRRGQADAQAKHIIGVVMDAETGEILGLGQSPGFNPNQVKDISPELMKNYVLQDAFEPGSTFKPLVAAVVMDQGLTKPEEMVDCEMGKYQVGKYTIRDVHPAGVISVRDVLVRSSNVCMVKLGQRLGKEKLGSALKEYGFGKATGIKLQGEGEGILREPSRWANIDVATHSFGQGISVTALQMLQAYSAIANDGVMVTPTILKRANGEGKRVLKPETARTMFDILTGVTEDSHGTGKSAMIQGVRVAGKTGTAQKSRSGARGYDPNRVLASFIGMVDASEIGINKKLIMFVAVDEPMVRPRWGGVVAAPVFRRSMERILSHLLTGYQNGVQTAATKGRSRNL